MKKIIYFLICSPYEKAMKHIENREYENIIDLCAEELGNQASAHVSEALLLRGTFYTLRGEGDKAMSDFNKLLDKSDVHKRVILMSLSSFLTLLMEKSVIVFKILKLGQKNMKKL